MPAEGVWSLAKGAGCMDLPVVHEHMHALTCAGVHDNIYIYNVCALYIYIYIHMPICMIHRPWVSLSLSLSTHIYIYVFIVCPFRGPP